MIGSQIRSTPNGMLAAKMADVGVEMIGQNWIALVRLVEFWNFRFYDRMHSLWFVLLKGKKLTNLSFRFSFGRGSRDGFHVICCSHG